MSQDDGYAYCSSKLICYVECCIYRSDIQITSATGLGLGLALWKGAERYEDVKYIANNLNEQLITALNNDDLNDCSGFYDSTTSCDAQLVKIYTINYIINPVSTY